MSDPFFIIGCPRSGTTLLRDLLRDHPKLDAPEETHFYRYPFPFGSPAFSGFLLNNEVLRRHRAMDGFDEGEFSELFRAAATRRELQDTYMASFLDKRGNAECRWFDKTPQNSYGALMMAADYPEARFIHMLRHPFSVAASLKRGQLMPSHEVLTAANFWLEGVRPLRLLAELAPKRVLTIHYETLCRSPMDTLTELLEFVGEDVSPGFGSDCAIRFDEDGWRRVLDDEDIALLTTYCAEEMARLGYDSTAS